MIAMDRNNDARSRSGERSPDRVDASGNAGASPMTALVDVVRAAQRMILARIDLAAIQAKDAVQGAAMIAAAAFVATFGWIFLMCGAVTLLDDFVPLPAAFAIVGGVHLAAGIAVAFIAKSRAEPGHSTLAENDDR